MPLLQPTADCDRWATDFIDWDGQLVLVTSTSLVLVSQNEMIQIELNILPDQLILWRDATVSPDGTWVVLPSVNNTNEQDITLYNLENHSSRQWSIGLWRMDGWYDANHVNIIPPHNEFYNIESRLLNIHTGEWRVALDWEQHNIPPVDFLASVSESWSHWREQYSPNGNYIFYRSNGSLTLADLTTDEVIWSRPSPLGFPHFATWSPNNEGVVYVESELIVEGVEPVLDNNLFAVDISGQDALIYDGYVYGESLVWSSSGDHLAFLTYQYAQSAIDSATCLHIIDSPFTSSLPENHRMVIRNYASDVTWVSDDILAFRDGDDIWIVDIVEHTTMTIPIDLGMYRLAGWMSGG